MNDNYDDDDDDEEEEDDGRVQTRMERGIIFTILLSADTLIHVQNLKRTHPLTH